MLKYIYFFCLVFSGRKNILLQFKTRQQLQYGLQETIIENKYKEIKYVF